MTTKAQKWARKRNWQKGQLMAIRHGLKNKIFTKDEQAILALADQYIQSVLITWKVNNKKSKQNYLKS